MELTKEYFDSQFNELNGRLNNMATKAELQELRAEMATKTDLQELRHDMEEYTNSVAETIIEAVDGGFKKVDERLTRLESLKQI